jgi:polar amino acid transport system ATP-binding protein
MRLEIQGLSKSFGEHPVLRGVELHVPDGLCLALVGPSGGGKTTLLRILAGLEFPDCGSVRMVGEPLAFDDRSLAAHRRRVGTVFQAFNLFPHLTALENILLPLTRVHQRSASEARAIAISLLRRFQLEPHLHKKPSQLSGGQRQRVAIIRAIAIDARVIFLDEPTSALDPEMTAEVLDLVAELKNEGKHLVIVTHMLGFARKVADTVALLAEGRIAEAGPPRQVFDSPASPQARQFLAKVLRW